MAFNRQDDHRKSKLLKVEEKWKIIFNQKTRAPVYSPQQYSEHLRKYSDGGQGSDRGDDRPVAYLLRKLKVDLQMSFNSFVEEFVDDTNQGLVLLLNLLKVTQKSLRNLSTAKKKSVVQETKRILTEEHDCLLCIKYSLRLETVVQSLLDESYGLETVASSLMSAFTKSRIVALEVMNVMLTEPRGFARNLDCFTYFRLKNGEPVRFRFLISMLMSNTAQNIPFQVCGMKFLNALLSATPDSNTRIYLQNEFRMAGLDIDVMKQNVDVNKSLENVELEKELDEFCRNNLDVDALLESRSELESNYSNLQRQVSMLRGEVELNKSRELDFLSEDGLSIKTEEEGHGDCAGSNPVPEPPPLPTPGPNLAQMIPKREFPFFNWQPLENVNNTIFQTMDANQVLNKDVMEDLTQTFQLRTHSGQQPNTSVIGTYHKDARTKTEATVVNDMKGARVSSKSSFLDCGRSKSIVIAMRQIGKSADVIRQAVQELDADTLSADHAELLLRFIPTDAERSIVLSMTWNYQDLAEAEQLIVQFVSIEDLEEKLKTLVFMGQFDDKIARIKPIIHAVNQASISLWNCLKIHKVFEIILCLGNHLNASKRGLALGFRLASLASLSQLKSRDKSVSLLDFLVTVVRQHFPGIANWYIDLELPPIDKCSYTVLIREMKELADGMTDLDRLSTATRQIHRFQIFHSAAKRIMDDVSKSFCDMELQYQTVCSMYGEDYRIIEPSEFFGYFRQFSIAYKEANDLQQQSSMSRSPTRHFSIHKPQPLENNENIHNETDASGIVDENEHDNDAEYCNISNAKYQISRKAESDSFDSTSCQKCTDDVIPNAVMDSNPNDMGQSTNNSTVDVECVPDYSVDLYMGSDLDLDEDDEDNEQGLYLLDPYGLEASEKSKVENWIIKNNKVLMKERQHMYHCDISCKERSLQTHKRNHDVISHAERAGVSGHSDSEDSAFGGSDGNVLRSEGNRSRLGFVNSNTCPRTSTPHGSSPLDEPLPDYPACSVTGSVHSNNSYSSELSRILNDFEGNLNRYDNESLEHSQRKFYTVRSIIYL